MGITDAYPKNIIFKSRKQVKTYSFGLKIETISKDKVCMAWTSCRMVRYAMMSIRYIKRYGYLNMLKKAETIFAPLEAVCLTQLLHQIFVLPKTCIEALPL